MQQEVKEWLEQAREDMDAARYLLQGEKYKQAAFYCQQVAEKALKALSIQREGTFRKIHDLVELGKVVGLPDHLEEYCEEITPAYLYTRYPNIVPNEDLEKSTRRFISHVEEIIRWVEKQL